MDAKFTRKLIQVGDSLGITIPKEELEGKKVGDLVKISLEFFKNKEV